MDIDVRHWVHSHKCLKWLLHLVILHGSREFHDGWCRVHSRFKAKLSWPGSIWGYTGISKVFSVKSEEIGLIKSSLSGYPGGTMNRPADKNRNVYTEIPITLCISIKCIAGQENNFRDCQYTGIVVYQLWTGCVGIMDQASPIILAFIRLHAYQPELCWWICVIQLEFIN